MDKPIQFGCFRLYPTAGRLEKNGQMSKLGRSGIDILIALVSHAGDIQSSSDLAAAAWPGKAFDDKKVRAQIGQLRRLIEEDPARPRYITNIPGRGYCFMMPESPASPPSLGDIPRMVGLTRILGRDDVIRATAKKVLARRLVTIVGPGGIGKTTTARAILAVVRENFSDVSRFVDLGALREGALLPVALASAFGVPVQSDNPIASLIGYLKDKHALVVLDCCEHLLEDLAPIINEILREVPDLHILATSREPIRLPMENVSRLPPLAVPPAGAGIEAAEIRRYPAVQLFMERVAASLAGFAFLDADLPVVADICRKLDGIALAIELAAACVSVHGLKGVERLMDDRFKLLTQGRRTASARHRSLRAMLDWSYDLLAPVERIILRRLAVFVGPWPLKAGLDVVASTGLSEADIFHGLGNLMSKSLISVDKTCGVARYRLLDMTRSYAWERLEEHEETQDALVQHALFYRTLLSSSADAFSDYPADHRRTILFDAVGNVRAALGWCFSGQGATELGIELVAAAGPLFLELSIVTEGRAWAEKALAKLDPAAHGGRQEGALRELLGLSLLFGIGNNQEVGDTLNRAHGIAESLGEHSRQLRLLGALHIHNLRTANFHGAMSAAEQSKTVADKMGDPGAVKLAEWLLAIAHHHLGDQRQAVRYGRTAMTRDDSECQLEMARLGSDHRLRTLSALARSFWLVGLPDQALTAARTAIEDATALGHPVVICVSLIWTMPVFIWTGDLDMADQMVAALFRVARENSLHPLLAVGPGLEGELLIRRGHHAAGLRKLGDCLNALSRGWHPLVASIFTSKFAEALLLTGETAEALAAIEAAIARAKGSAELVNLPDMLRLKANILVGMRRDDEAESCYLASMDLARSQFALSWELRTALDYAALLSRQGREEEAIALVAPLHGRFTEGRTTTDLARARLLLDRLGSPPCRKTA